MESVSTDVLHRVRHSAAHVMAAAVTRLYPDVKLDIGPPTRDGFYYDFDTPHRFTPDDLEKIEAEMAGIVAENVPFERTEMSRDEADTLLRKHGQSYKVERLRDIAEGDAITLYRCGDFADLCAGPHVERTGDIGAFKLLSIAGAYYRGSETNPMLQRIYGTAFPTREELDDYLAQREEARKRDHRRLGKDLDLFSFSPEIGGGLVLWHPRGAAVRSVIEDHWKAFHREQGYQLVSTPHIASEEIYRISGHLEAYREMMYAPMDIEGRPYRVKPMNCPAHIMIYKSRPRSYRDLPLRYAELGAVYRFEKGGVLHGLLRVRGFTIDDAHIFCTPDELEQEILSVFSDSMAFLRLFGFTEFAVYLATRPEKFVGTPERWDEATARLRQALDQSGQEYEVEEGGGAFYGPKIDIKVTDCLGRSWQCSTIQFDFNLPERFDVAYTDATGADARPFMVHRALLGSIERFFGVLVEHYGGAFPFWLAPEQVRVLPITDKQHEYAGEVLQGLRSAGLRAEADLRSEKVGAKIRDAQLEKVPYMIVVGGREAEGGTVAVRHRSEGDLGAMPLDAFLARARDEEQLKS
jgi:threonyl-tRNA synthetase